MKKLSKLLAIILSLCTLCFATNCSSKINDDNTACRGNHTWGDWVVMEEATCTQKGISERVCSACGKKETKTIPARGHDFSETEVETEDDGTLVTLRRCSRCNATGDRKEVKNGIAVRNAEDFRAAVTVNNAYIVLMCDIADRGTTNFNIRPGDTDLNVTINLNKHRIFGELNVCTTWKQENGKVEDCGKKLKVKLLNGYIGLLNEYKSSLESKEHEIYYGILVNGVGVNLTVENVSTTGYYGGLYTNGANAGSTITMKNCKIQSVWATIDEDRIYFGYGAYLAGGHTVTFDDCEFIGLVGTYIKSGKVTMNNCSVTATAINYFAPNYNGNGADGEGSGIIIDSANYNIKSLIFIMNGGSITTANGYALEQVVTKGENYSISTLNGVTMDVYGKAYDVWVTTKGAVTVKN